ncbi:MAG: EamA family transporter [Candidatus Nanopelagicales bacterium]
MSAPESIGSTPPPGPRTSSPTTVGSALVLVSMTSVQLGAAGSVALFDDIGPGGTAWLRLTWAGLILLAVVRPRLQALTGTQWRAALLLGAVSAALTLSFLAAIDRLPLGTAVAVEFLGPLGVATAQSRRRSALIWPVVAALGVLALTRPWSGDLDLVGLGYALAAAACWASYILLTQHVGDALPGLTGLAISLPAAALVATPWGIAQAVPNLTWLIVAQGLGLAILLPLVPYVLELSALRRLTTSAFGVLMSLEPAIGTVVGAVLLSQGLSWLQAAGIALVVTAGMGAARQGARL